MEFKIASVDSVIIYFSSLISEEAAQKIQLAFKKIRKANLPFIVSVTPSYTSILVRFNPLTIDHNKVQTKLQAILVDENHLLNTQKISTITIPVLYDEKVGLDLKDVANMNNLSIDEVIRIHSQKEYLVFAIGFLPGFAYMGEVDSTIATPRIANPRAKVPQGSVGIADTQSAVYPKESPGGWRILGRTPIDMFDLEYDGFSYLQVGDKVRFNPIDKDEFLLLGGVL